MIVYIICSYDCLVSEAQILHEKTSSSLEILMKFSKDYSISIEQLIVIFNGFVHVMRLALKPPAAFLKSDVNHTGLISIQRNKILWFSLFRYLKMIYVI
jgi:hypothetical protein